MSHVHLFLALLVICSTYALARGGAPERVGTLILLAGIAATALVASKTLGRFSSVEWGIFFVDGVVFLSYLALALTADRFWPMVTTAVVGFGVVAHAAVLLTNLIVPHVYAAAQAFSGYPVVLLLAIGTYRHRRRLRTFGTDRAWSISFGRSTRSEP